MSRRLGLLRTLNGSACTYGFLPDDTVLRSNHMVAMKRQMRSVRDKAIVQRGCTLVTKFRRFQLRSCPVCEQ